MQPPSFSVHPLALVSNNQYCHQRKDRHYSRDGVRVLRANPFNGVATWGLKAGTSGHELRGAMRLCTRSQHTGYRQIDTRQILSFTLFYLEIQH